MPCATNPLKSYSPLKNLLLLVGMGIYGSTLLPSTLLRDSEWFDLAHHLELVERQGRTVTILSLSKDPIPDLINPNLVRINRATAFFSLSGNWNSRMP
jgi:hypothetical protein